LHFYVIFSQKQALQHTIFYVQTDSEFLAEYYVSFWFKKKILKNSSFNIKT